MKPSAIISEHPIGTRLLARSASGIVEVTVDDVSPQGRYCKLSGAWYDSEADCLPDYEVLEVLWQGPKKPKKEK